MNAPNPLALKFRHVPLEFIPKIGTPAYVLLKLLSEGEQVDRWQPSLGECMRSALQTLRGDKLGNWLIPSVKVCGKKHSVLMLDQRHLSGDLLHDQDARRERRRAFKEDSHKQARLERIREPKAYREMTEAQRAYFESLGDAANDE